MAIQTLTAGSGMTAAPTITITDSSGSGATADATVTAGAISGVTVTNAGSLYSSTPTVTPTGGVAAGVGGGRSSGGANLLQNLLPSLGGPAALITLAIQLGADYSTRPVDMLGIQGSAMQGTMGRTLNQAQNGQKVQ